MLCIPTAELWNIAYDHQLIPQVRLITKTFKHEVHWHDTGSHQRPLGAPLYVMSICQRARRSYLTAMLTHEVLLFRK
eukprot:569257-Amphidinium_carterae.1